MVDYKWVAGACFLGILYLVWPYYTLLELASAARSGDAASIKELVDWERVRLSLKAQLQAHLETTTKRAEQQAFAKEYPAFATLGNVLALSIADRLIDTLITPQGLANLLKGGRVAASAAKEQSAPAKPSGNRSLKTAGMTDYVCTRRAAPADIPSRQA
jgi:hypothetical protein